MNTQTKHERNKSRNDSLDAINNKLDEAGDATSDAASDAGNWISEQRNKLKGDYHEWVADNSDDADDELEHRMKATESRAKAAGYALK